MAATLQDQIALADDVLHHDHQIHAHNRLAHVLERRGMEKQTTECDRLLSSAVENYTAAAKLQAGLAKRFPRATAYQVWLKDFENSAREVQAELNRTPP